jgi:acyl-CoA thioesterase-1
MERYIYAGSLRRVAVAWLAALSCVACGGGAGGNAATGDDTGDRPAAAPESERRTVLVVGTSLTAGLGVDPGEAWPAHLQRMIDSAGLPYQVVAAGVSGETSAGALARMDWVLRQRPAVLIVETGANDGLRGLAPDALEENLTQIVERTRSAVPDAEIAIVQMEAPPNLGRRYTDEFRSVFADVAREHDATLLPFPLARVAGIDSLNQPDGIHPTPAGHRLMAEAVWPELEPLLEGTATARPAALP